VDTHTFTPPIVRQQCEVGSKGVIKSGSCGIRRPLIRLKADAAFVRMEENAMVTVCSAMSIGHTL